ncbi:MAG: MFS transporter [Flavobacteriales bacterium]|nr:MFS transporter [Flavobacteriales bacterium]
MSLSGPSSFAAQRTAYPVLFAIAFSHLLNDTVQALIPALYPLVKASYQLSYAQIGLITLTFQTTASILQPLVGHSTDKHPRPFALVGGMGPRSSVSSCSPKPHLRLAPGGRGAGRRGFFHLPPGSIAHGLPGLWWKRSLSQSVFQLGGNMGSAIGPLLAALIIVPLGQATVGWFVVLPLIPWWVLWRVGRWYVRVMAVQRARQATSPRRSKLPTHKVVVIDMPR